MNPYQNFPSTELIVSRQCLSVTVYPDTEDENTIRRHFQPGVIRTCKVKPTDERDSTNSAKSNKLLLLFDSIYSADYHLGFGSSRKIGDLTLQIKLCDSPNEIPKEWLRICQAPVYPGMQRFPGPGNQGFQQMHGNPYANQPQQEATSVGQDPGQQNTTHPPGPYGFGHPYGQFRVGYPGPNQGPQGHPNLGQGHPVQGYPGQGNPMQGYQGQGYPGQGQLDQRDPGQGHFAHPGFPPAGYMNFPGYFQHQGTDQFPVPKEEKIENKTDNSDESGNEESWSPPGVKHQERVSSEKMPLITSSPPPSYEQSETQYGMPPGMKMPIPSNVGHGMPHAANVPTNFPYGMPHLVPPSAAHGTSHGIHSSSDVPYELQQKGNAPAVDVQKFPFSTGINVPPRGQQVIQGTDRSQIPPNSSHEQPNRKGTKVPSDAKIERTKITKSNVPLNQQQKMPNLPSKTPHGLPQRKQVAEIPNQDADACLGSDYVQSTTEPARRSQDKKGNIKDTQSDEKDEDDEDDRPTSIKVSNLPKETTEESLEMFFESKKRSGGDDIETIEFDDTTMTAVVTFQDPDTVNRVMSRAPLVFNKKQIRVEIFQREDDDEKDESEEEEDEEDDECTVEVRGMKETTTDDNIEMFFENKRKSGGGGEVQIKKEEEDDDLVYYVTFESKEVAQRVLSKKQLTLDGAELEVKLYKPPPPPKPVPMYENRVFIHGFGPATTKDSVENFLEAKAHADVSDLTYGEEEGTALVTFETPPDFGKLESVCKKRQLDKHWLHVSRVPVTRCIIVTNFKETTTEDTLEMYFDNKKRSAGENVEKVEMVKDEGYCLVYFENSEVCENVCKKSSHTVDGQKLKVQIYHECIGIPSSDQDGVRLKLPDPITLKQLDARKMQFLYRSKPNKDALELQVSKTHGKITWPQKYSDPLKIECTLSKGVKDCKKLAKTWKNDITDAVIKFLSVLVVKILQVLQEGWSEVKKELTTLNVDHPDGVAVILEKESKEIVIVGHKTPVSEVHGKVDAIIKKVSDELDRKKQQVTEKMSLKYHQVMYLSMQHFKEETEKQFPDMKLELKMKEREVVFSGLSGNVSSAKLLLFERLNAVCSSSAGVFSKPRVSFLFQNNDVKKYIAQKMKEANVLAVWEIQNKEEVMTFAASDDDAVQAAHIIKGEIVESPVKVPQNSLYLLEDPKYAQRCDEIKRDYPLTTFTTIKKESTVLVVTVNENLANVREMIEDFFTFNTIFSEEMNLTPHMLKFLNIRYKREIEKIPKDLISLQVGVELSKQKIVIKGTKDGLFQAKQQIDRILNNIKKRRHELRRPGIVKLIKSEQGKAKISKVEKSSRCTIKVEGEEEKDLAGGKDHDLVRSWSSQRGGTAKLNNGEVAKHRSQSGVIISVHKGDLTNMDVDMLVNAANAELKHNGGLAKALVKKGGDSIQQECTGIVKQRGRLNDGDVVITSSGKLKCKKIAHAVGPAWKGGDSQERENLEDCIMTSLKETDDLHLSTIAIPALCTGIFGFPVSEATLVILRAVKKYLRKNLSTGIKSILLCDVRDETVVGFCQAMKKEYGGKVTFVQKIGDATQNGGNSISKIERQTSHQEPTEITIGKVCVKIVKGQIGKQTVDVIVNTVSKDLNLTQGFVSNSLLKAGGETLQEECKNNYPDGIEFGDVAVTSGGKLKCKHVFHGALPSWSPDNPLQSLEVLQTFLNNCFKEGSKKKAKSIAMPAMGTGKLGYQRDLVAKHMFDAAAGVSGHTSSIKEVRFVIYEKDTDVLQAFDKEIASRASSNSTPRDKAKKKGPRHGKNLEKKEEEFDFLPEVAVPPSDQRVSVALGSINLSIYQGDLTAADVDVIVNSTNSEIDLSKGAVAKSIQKLGGKELEKQVQVQKENMKKEGVAVTTNGGPSSKLSSKFIVHVDAQNDKKTWKQKIVQILQKAEDLKMKSIAMPALGTGIGNVPVSDIARHMYDAIEKFQKDAPPQHLHDVHIVIYQQQMVQTFIIAMQGCFQGAKPKGLLGKALNWISGGGDKEDPSWQAKVSKQPPSTSCVTLVIFGDNDGDIDKALSHLEKIIDEDFSTKEFRERIIAQLSQNQVKQIKQLETKHDVKVTVDQSSSIIKLHGTHENLMGAADAVHNVIRDAEKNKQAKQQAELVSEMVQWCFLETGADKTSMEEYPANVNLIIESAFRNKEPVAKFKDNSGNEYTISFENMEEYPTNIPDDKVKVLRKEKLRDAAFELPKTWKEMKESENLTVEQINIGDQEYKDVIGKFHNSVGSNRQIVKLERIQNKMLFQQYLAKKKLLDAQNQQGTQNERELWHGTAPEAVDSINCYGFNRSYCGKNATAFGDGVYFAVHAQYSAQDQYSRKNAQGNKQMYLCRVLTGEFTVGQSGMRVPPPKPGSGGVKHILYDSVSNNMQNPIMFIIFNDTQAYPDYLVTFK